MIREKAQLLAFKIETTSGTENVPSPTVNAIRTSGIPVVMVDDLEDGNRDDMETGLLGTVGRAAGAGGFVRVDNLTLEVSGPGSVYSTSVVPEIDPFLRAAGFARTLDATTGNEQLVYSTLDAGMETGTLYAWAGGKLIKAVGCVFTPKFSSEVNKRVMMTGTLTGKLLSAPTTASVPAHAFSGAVPMIWNTPLSIGSWNGASGDPLRATKMDIDLGTVVSDLPGAGAADGLDGYVITDRKASLSLDVRVPALSTFDPYALRRTTGGALPVVSIIAGSQQYSRVNFQTGPWQLKTPTPAARNGVAMYTLSGPLAHDLVTPTRELIIAFF